VKRLPIDPDGARRLLCAILLSACKDAQRGDPAARAWLDSDGALWADMLDIAHPDTVRTWARCTQRACPGPLPKRSEP